MKLGDLEFKAIDFQGLGTPLGTDLTPFAEKVNRLLRERLEKAPIVRFHPGPDCWDEQEILGDTHTARLVCVEELP